MKPLRTLSLQSSATVLLLAPLIFVGKAGHTSQVQPMVQEPETTSPDPGADASVQPAAAGTLANVALLRTNSLLSPGLVALGKTQTQYHTIQFRTGTAGVIAKVEVLYEGGQPRPEIAKSKLIATWGIGPGGWAFQSGTQGAYTVASPQNVPAGTSISIMLGDIYATSEGCYFLSVRTRDPGENEIEFGSTGSFSGPTAICNNEIGAEGLQGVQQLAFGTCTIDPPKIKDNDEVQLHMNGLGAGILGGASSEDSWNMPQRCDVRVTGSARVIAVPPADFDRGLVPKGSSAHCTSTGCHLDVRIRNVRQPDGNVDAGPRVWTWIAFQPE